MIHTFVASQLISFASEYKKVTGVAAHAFNNDKWISGVVHLPPKAIKDEESVGECTQIFVVGSCQPDSRKC